MDKKEGMNRWKLALLLGGGLAAALLWGCFNPIHAGIMGGTDPGSADEGSENQGSTDPGVGLNPGDGAAGEFTVTLRVGEDSRSVVGPSAEDIRYKGVWNTVQVIAVDAETQEVKDNQLVKLDNENDSGKTIWVDVAQGKRYHILVLMGHTELNYANEDPEYEYKSDPPTLLAAGFLEDQAIHGQATLSVTMKPLVVDTVFTHGDSVTQAALPDKKTGKGAALPAEVAASVVWTVSGGFATLVDAQTRTGLPGGLNWGGLTLTETTFIRNGADLLEPTPVLGGEERNQIVLDLGPPTKGLSGSANFRLTYNPLGEKETWIIRNGVNDEAQDEETTFTFEGGKIPWDGETANGNGAVGFIFEDQKVSDIDLASAIPAPVTGGVPETTPLPVGKYQATQVSWKAVGGKSLTRFEGETVYVAEVTLKAGTGFFLRTVAEGSVTVTHDGSSDIRYMSKTDTQVVVEVLFPKTGVFWEYGGYFSRDDGGDMNSAIDVIREAQAKGFSSLSLKLLHPWPEEVDLTATSTDIGKEGSLKLGNTNSPALVTLDGGGREIALKAGTGSVITVGDGVTLTLRNITFKGSAANNVPLIKVESGGTLVLEDGAVITGNNNTNSIGGGVYVGGGGALVMNGGAISGNTSSATGGMFNGGGGVYLLNSTFTMDGGKISGNTTAKYGGGVGLYDKSTFTMNKGVISGNTGIRGGGVDNFWGTFTMYGGIIYGKEDAHGDKKNTASGGSGAAVYNDSTARWNEKKDGVLETLNTTDATLDLR